MAPFSRTFSCRSSRHPLHLPSSTRLVRKMVPVDPSETITSTLQLARLGHTWWSNIKKVNHELGLWDKKITVCASRLRTKRWELEAEPLSTAQQTILDQYLRNATSALTALEALYDKVNTGEGALWSKHEKRRKYDFRLREFDQTHQHFDEALNDFTKCLDRYRPVKYG